MKVIGAGFGRTGTLSLQAALQILGFGKCYHMTEVFKHRGHIRHWSNAAEGRPVDWQALFEGYQSCVDWPACHFYKELMELYPDAKVLLSVRDFDGWYESASQTIYRANVALPISWVAPLNPVTRTMWRVIQKVIWIGTFRGEFSDKEKARATFQAHVDEVKRVVPVDRLLVYEVKQGWEPLCRFLGVPVPANMPFPRLNDSAEFQNRIRIMQAFQWLYVATVLGIPSGLLWWFWG